MKSVHAISANPIFLLGFIYAFHMVNSIRRNIVDKMTQTLFTYIDLSVVLTLPLVMLDAR